MQISKPTTRVDHTKLRPVEDRLVVLPKERDSVTKGGIHLPDNRQEDPLPIEGTVYSVGPGKMVQDSKGDWVRQPMMIKPNDRVLFSRWAGPQARDLGEYMIIKESDVLAVLE